MATACHAGLDPASSSGFEDWILAFAKMTKAGGEHVLQMGLF